VTFPADPPAGLEIESLYGNCPVQAEGRIDGEPFYFRARWAHWSFGVGGDPVCAPAWEYVEDYGEDDVSAGWMSVDEAYGFILAAIERYRAWKAEQTPAP
jgi:hypothetical protein